MESHQILSKQKLSFSASFREAIKILSTQPKFISLIIFFSFPLFASLLVHHILLHPTFIQLLKLLYHQNHHFTPPHSINSALINCDQTTATHCNFQTSSTPHVSHRFLISTFLLSSPLIYFLDLLNTIATVSISAAIYGSGNTPQIMGFKEMLLQVRRVDLKGPLATSLCAVLLASLTLLGLVALSTHLYFMTKGTFLLSIDVIVVSKVSILALIFGPIFVVLLGKYVEWSAVWNMGIVISILDKNRQGYIAIGVASYLSRGSRKLGFSLMMVFFVMKVVFGLPCLYALWNEGSCGVLRNVVFVSLNCVVNVVMWVVLMVYFYDCKREFLEKKIDLENNGKLASEAVQQ